MKKFLIITFIILSFSLSANSKKSKEELRGEELEFGKIKKVLENDFLKDQATKKVRQVKSIKRKRIKDDTKKYNFPDENDFWKYFSELWLVRNAQELKWDFQKPDYGLRVSIEGTLEKFGYLEQKFRLLLVDSPVLTHFCLPYSKEEVIFVLSVPFIRTLDLTKREIGILLIEDFIRHELGYFKNYVLTNEVKNLIGSNFKKNIYDQKTLDKVLKNISYFVYEKGFDFQQQFNATNKVSSILKSDLEYWNSYLSLLQKIDRLVKTNALYKKYTNIFPSPELQMKWILPKKKVL